MKLGFCLALAALLPCLRLASQTTRVLDLARSTLGVGSDPYAARALPGGSYRTGFVRSAGLWFFVASTLDHGAELYATDGTRAGTRLVRDVHAGFEPADIRELIDASVGTEPRVFFVAEDGVHGAELWTSDGTSNGTRLVHDIVPGAASSRPSDLEVWKGQVYFAADDGMHGYELWCSDGSVRGTRMVVDLWPGTAGSEPSQLLALPDQSGLIFRACQTQTGCELWRSDGSVAGTQLVRDVRAGRGSSYPSSFQVLGQRVLFGAHDGVHGFELWITDGSNTGTRLLKDIRKGVESSLPILVFPARIGARLYFVADDGIHGSELWSSDGTGTGTRLVHDVRKGPDASHPNWLVATKKGLWFSAIDDAGRELWFSDATSTRRVADIAGGPSSSAPSDFAELPDGRVLFSAWTADHGAALHVSDATPVGTRLVVDLTPGPDGERPSLFTRLAPGVYLFVANAPAVGIELFVSFADALTVPFADLERRTIPASSLPTHLSVESARRVWFAAGDDRSGLEPWISDGSALGTRRVCDLRPGSASSGPNEFVHVWTRAGMRTLFVADDGVHGRELFVSDGTSSGTTLLADLRKGVEPSHPRDLRVVGSRVFFSADDGVHGRELWVTDTTTTGTRLVRDIAVGAHASEPGDGVALGGKYLFTADDGKTGRELWISDGTKGGTRLVLDLFPGQAHGSPAELTRVGSTVYFAANDSVLGNELFATDGTTMGTRLVRDICPTGSSQPTHLVAFGERLFFHADDGVHGDELWASGGDAATTTLVHDVEPGPGSSFPRSLACSEDRLWFTAWTSQHGNELWVSDGSSSGTRLVRDIAPGALSSGTTHVRCVGARCYFDASPTGRDTTLWTSDGTSAGTHTASPVLVPRNPGLPTVADGRLFYAARTPRHGSELFVIDRPGASAEPLDAHEPRLRIDAPVRGRAASFAAQGPTGRVGVLMLDAVRAPLPWTGSVPAWVQPLFAIPVAVGAAKLTGDLRVPDDAGLTGIGFHLQAWWLTPNTVLPITLSNGVRLTVGS